VVRASTSETVASRDTIRGGATAPFCFDHDWRMASMIDFSLSYFDLFGLPARFRFDPASLDAAYRALQSQVHPDRFAGGTDTERRLALQSSTRVNEAYRALKDPVQRAQYLLRMHGVEAVEETDTGLPLEFLETQLERREAASEAHETGDVRTLSALVAAVRADAAQLEQRLAQRLDAEQAYEDARSDVRELTFLTKLARDLDELAASLDP
jgi:molecular chaperone HscB